jgi:hypothetical protein
MVSNWVQWLFGKGDLYHLWSDKFDFVVKNLITGETVTAAAVDTPAGTRWVYNTNLIFFRVYDTKGEQIYDLCKRAPCAVSGWSYVVGTEVQPWWPYNQDELLLWFRTDKLFKTYGDANASLVLAKDAMKALDKGESFDLGPYLATK